jgi:hypothetical protein
MSNDFAKFKNSQRRHKTDVHIARQLAIAKQSLSHDTRLDRQPHRLAKHNAMDCGTPGCTMCGNPRRNEWMKKERRTTQERRQMQDVDTVRDVHSNGLTPEND